jgi:toxin ParE1/3/4
MTYSLRIQAEAIIDLLEAFEWYEKQKQGLGVELIEEIQIGYKKYAAIHNIILLLMIGTEN